MFNDHMRNISRSLYLQTRHYRAELLLDGISKTTMLIFGLKFLDDNHWRVIDIELKEDVRTDILETVYIMLSNRLKRENDHGVFMVSDSEDTFKGVLYGIEGMIAHYNTSHNDMVKSYQLYDYENCEDEKEGLYEIQIGDPIVKPDQWDLYMNKIIDKEQ